MAKTKGIIVELGGDASGLNKAISSVSKEARDTQSELKKIERLLKMDPGNVTLLKQKQELLNESISKTEDVITALKDAKDRADADMANGTEINEKAYRELERQIEANEITLKNTRKEADKVADALNSIDSDELRDVARAADDAEEALEDAAKEAADFGDVLKANMISDAASGIVDSLRDVAEETKEYRKIMGSLEVSSEAAGYTADQTSEAYRRLYGVLADDQSAATTLANLQALELNQEDLLTLIDNVIGGWAKYGDSIPIDGLAEAVNETIRAGQVTGTFADIINWGAREGETYGVKMREATEANEEWNESVAAAETAEDFFNIALQECATEAERVNLVMQAMADQGLGAMAEKWKENNESMIANNEANAELQEQMGQLGETLEPIMTMLVELTATALSWFNSLDEGSQKFILSTVLIIAAIGPVVAAIGGISTAVDGVTKALPMIQNAFTTVFGYIAANPVNTLIAAILMLVVYVVSTSEEIQANLAALAAAIVQIFAGIIDFIAGVFTGDWERAWSGIVQIFQGIFSGIGAAATAAINIVIGMVNTAIDGINWLISNINRIPGVSIGNVGKIPMLADGGTVWSGSAIVGEAGPELLTVSGGKAVVQPLTANTGKIEGLLGDISSQLGGGGYDIPIVVQVTVDGKVLGETATQYIRRQDRAYGK